MNLVIVESPTKARTISKFLGKGYEVQSSFGHIRDLPKSALGIDLEHNFAPTYVVPVKAKKVVSELKKIAAKSERVILASDEDREGEAIAWHLAEALGLGNSKSEARNSKQTANSKSEIPKVERIVFHEITKHAIDEALTHPRGIDMRLVDAQQARRVLDRLVGYKLSPFLWRKVAKGLSAGRVQSVALRLIVDRENEIRAFKAEEYWTIEAMLRSRGQTRTNTRKHADTTFLATLVKIEGKALEKFAIPNQQEAERIKAELEECVYAVAKVEHKELKRMPSPPFTTSTLQQEAAKRLGFSAKKTMMVAQHLYENGHITYMRTDSVNLSTESTAAAKQWLHANLGAAYAADAPRAFTAKSKLAQEAHEAIRPTDPRAAPDAISLVEPAARKLYDLIWRRFMASQMPTAKISATTVTIDAVRAQLPITNYQLRASGQQILFDGYLKIWPVKFEERELPPLQETETLDLKEVKPEQHFTEPPPRFSEATLVKTLEEYGIGRPSTYAPTISVIQIRNYVRKDKGRFFPTEIGELVSTVLVAHFPEIVDIGFTAKMEESLDAVAEGKEEWHDVIGSFYTPFAKHLEEKYAEVKKASVEQTDEKCEKCGRAMVIRMGRFGRFLACSGFPECRNTKPVNGENGAFQKEPPKPTGLQCPKCAEGDVVERRVNRGRARGKRFWGCSRYPACDYATWEDPTKNMA